MLNHAISFAALAHNEQTDKSGEPYILHPLRVMQAVSHLGPTAMAAAVLHDVAEDAGVKLDDLSGMFGLAVAEIVDALTRRKGEKYRDFIRRAASHPIAREIKRADIRDTRRRGATAEIEAWAVSMRRERYEPALALIDAIEREGWR